MKRMRGWMERMGGYKGNWLRLMLIGWMLTNTLCLMMSPGGPLTLDFVRRIPFVNYLGLLAGICLCLNILYFMPFCVRRLPLSLVPSTVIYLATAAVKADLFL